VTRLPVSGTEFSLKSPDGSSEMVVLEADGSDLAAALALLTHSATLGLENTEQTLRELTITDFEYLLLSLRASWLGPSMTLGLTCTSCRKLAQLSLQASELLAQADPHTPPWISTHPSRHGWFIVEAAAFRLPNVGDLIAAEDDPHPVRALASRTLPTSELPRRLRARIERAMSAMAPELSRIVGGSCPACGAPLRAHLSVARMVLGELRQNAAQLHDEVDLIARNYHWPQLEILALPLTRRRAYVERIRRALAAAA
jgi:hypothetical protein